jgi:hypothetical protein
MNEDGTTVDVEALGRLVREVWVAWARDQPDAKPTWLVGWDDLPTRDQEVDRRIGLELWRAGFRDGTRTSGHTCAGANE